MRKLVFIAGLIVLALVVADFFRNDHEDLLLKKSPTSFSDKGSSSDKNAPGVGLPIDVAWPEYRNSQELPGRVKKIPGDKFKVIWKFQSGAPIKSGAIVEDGIVFFSNSKGHVSALNAKTGEPVWQKCFCNPITSTGLFLKVNDVPQLFVGNKHGDFLAMNASSGELLYKFKTGGAINGGATFFRGDDGLKVLFGSYDSRLYCLDSASGKEQWKFETSNYINGTPALSSGTFILGGCDGILRGINPSTGKQAFSLNLGSYIPSSPACSGNVAYVALQTNEVFAVDLSKFKILWKFQAEGQVEFYSPPAVSENYVVAPDSDGRIYVLKKSNGEKVRTLKLSGKLESEAIVDANKLLVADLDGFIYCFNLDSGAMLWRFGHGSAISAPLTVFDQYLLICDLDGWVTLYSQEQ
ncbi:MAG: PQQ-binding-like beta-propeller repeat protein [Candidatus Riflebacteria bacterium]|nr:PQQ-binding-like beta-propeller repeat protein [Candidatus Riflebacteria bacterium]